ncbi:hypothetical protein ACHAWF_007597 [Thalassiosira exigua]
MLRRRRLMCERLHRGCRAPGRCVARSESTDQPNTSRNVRTRLTFGMDKSLGEPEKALENRSSSFDWLLSMAARPFSYIFHSDGDRIMSHQGQRPHRQQTQRGAMYLPPAPVTPFRGNLKPAKIDDQEDDSGGTEFSDDSVEASSSDHAFRRDPGVKYSKKSSISSSNSVRSWAPEDFPDPWKNPILCGGAATASMVNMQQEDQQSYPLFNLGLGTMPEQLGTHIRRPLFCDPDQVLDEETLRNVVFKLREFAETFASWDVIEVGDMNTNDANDQPLNENTETGIQSEEIADRSEEDHDTNSTNDQHLSSMLAGPDLEVDLDLPGRLNPVVDSQSQETTDGGSEEGSDSSPNRRLSMRREEAKSAPVQQLRTTIHTDKQLYSDSVGGLFSTTRQDRVAKKKESFEDQRIEVAIALVQKDDMVNDAAQYFARYIHDAWSNHLADEQKSNGESSPTNIVLIFISTQDRICYISSGTRVAAILPWWRLEHVVQDMKTDLRRGETGHALNVAIEDLSALLLEGPPSFFDRVNDFFERFGVVLLFTIFTFVFATWGECRDRRKRIFFAERRSRMTAAEKEKARSLQKEFRTKMPFDAKPDKEGDLDTGINSVGKEKSYQKEKQTLKRVDDDGIPLIGTDDQPIKMLRCGHIFDTTCWSIWVDSGSGNPYICPVCRQDLGRSKRGSTATSSGSNTGGSADGADGREADEENVAEESSLFSRIVANATNEARLSRPHPSYNSLPPRVPRVHAPFAPLSHPTFRRLHQGLHPMFGLSTPPPPVGVSERTPLFAQTSLFAQSSSASNVDDDDY